MNTTTARRTGYICKSGCGPAPLGVGYTSNEPGAFEASKSLTACACGGSRLAKSAPTAAAI